MAVKHRATSRLPSTIALATFLLLFLATDECGDTNHAVGTSLRRSCFGAPCS